MPLATWLKQTRGRGWLNGIGMFQWRGSVATPDGGIELNSRPTDHSYVSSSRDVITTNKVTKREGTNDIRKLRRSAITLSLIVGVSSICWTPIMAI